MNGWHRNVFRDWTAGFQRGRHGRRDDGGSDDDEAKTVRGTIATYDRRSRSTAANRSGARKKNVAMFSRAGGVSMVFHWTVSRLFSLIVMLVF